MNIQKLEARPDWPLLAVAVPCPDCGAQPGTFCRDIHVFKSTGVTVNRPDFHAERKYQAAFAWYNRHQQGGLSEEEKRKAEGKSAEGYQEGGEVQR